MPNVVEDPCPFGIDPQIDVLRHHVADGFGAVLGVFHLVGEIVGAQTHAEVGIGLDPHLRVVPLRFIVERVDDAEQRIVLVNAAQHFDDVLPIGIADSRLVEACRRDDEHQRLPPCAESRLDDVEHSTVLVGVELVDDAATRIQTVVRAVIGRERLHHSAFEFIDDRVVWREVVFRSVALTISTASEKQIFA